MVKELPYPMPVINNRIAALRKYITENIEPTYNKVEVEAFKKTAIELLTAAEAYCAKAVTKGTNIL